MSLIAHFTGNDTTADLTGNYVLDEFTGSYATGKIGRALSIGSGNYLRTSSGAAFGHTVSVSAWAITTNSTGNYMLFSFNHQGSGRGPDLYFSQSRLQWNIGDGGGNPFYLNGSVVPIPSINVWHHYVVVNDAVNNETRLYIDGEFSGTATYRSTYQENNGFTIGNWVDGITTYGWPGQIDDLKIYDCDLSQKEVIDLYKGNYITANLRNSSGINVDATINETAPLEFNNGFVGDGTGAIIYSGMNATFTEITVSVYARLDTIGLNYVLDTDSQRDVLFKWADNVSDEIILGFNGTYSRHSIAYTLGEEIHVIMTYDGAIQKIFIEGAKIYESATTGTVSINTLYVGRYYSNSTYDFKGRIRDLQIFATEFSESEVANFHRLGLAVDDLGGIHSPYLDESGIINPNMLDYSTWTAGTTGSETGFGRNGSDAENYRILDADPFGKTVTVWEARPGATSNGDGGWNGSYYPIDNTKMYRFSVWIRRTVRGNGSFYLGTNGGGSAVLNRSNGNSNGNPYFAYGSWNFPDGEWVLIVGHVWPVGSGTGANHPDSGLYTVADGRVGDAQGNTGGNCVSASGTTSLRHRSYLYYSTNTSTRQQFLYPRMEVMDGTEPSINALLAGFDSLNYERTHNELGSTSVPDTLSAGRNKTKSGQFSEVGVTRGMISWFPLKNDAKDRVSNETATVVGAVPTTNGYSFDGVDDQIQTGLFSETDNLFNLASFSASFWMNLRSGAPSERRLVIGRDQSGGYFDVENENDYVQLRAAGIAVVRFYPTFNQWYHLVVVRDENTEVNSLYLDGVLLGSVTGSSSSYQSEIKIGGGHIIGISAGSSTIDGFIRNVKFYNTAVTPEEIAQEYASQSRALINKSTVFSTEFIEV